jgi:Sigma-70 factor, region 1.2
MTSTVGLPRVCRTAELDLFRLYLDEVGRHPLLTAEDEVELPLGDLPERQRQVLVLRFGLDSGTPGPWRRSGRCGVGAEEQPCLPIAQVVVAPLGGGDQTT